MKITFLGTGPSLGTPIISCKCEVCTSNDTRDKRLRSSVMIETSGKTIIIDAGPDFREQMLRYNPEAKLDAILITHEHRDHIAGLDDVRPFNFIQNKPVKIYATAKTLKAVKHFFSYSFEEHEQYKYGLPHFDLIEISDKPFLVEDIEIIPVKAFHSMPVLGFRINNFAYLTDIKTISSSEIEKIRGVHTLTVNALRRKIHPTHFNIEEALNLISEVKPQKAYLTHMAHGIGKHADLSKELPANVEPAYDGLTIEIID